MGAALGVGGVVTVVGSLRKTVDDVQSAHGGGFVEGQVVQALERLEEGEEEEEEEQVSESSHR